MKLRHLPRFAVAAGVLLFATGAVRAQHAVSARAGMINVAEGDVFLSDDRSPAPLPVDPRPSELISMKEGQTLRTGEGRAEILLTPGAFLRLGESSAVRLLSNSPGQEAHANEQGCLCAIPSAPNGKRTCRGFGQRERVQE